MTRPSRPSTTTADGIASSAVRSKRLSSYFTFMATPDAPGYHPATSVRHGEDLTRGRSHDHLTVAASPTPALGEHRCAARSHPGARTLADALDGIERVATVSPRRSSPACPRRAGD